VAFYFDEDIDCSLIDPIEDISFVYSDTDQDLNFEYTCVDNKIVFTPTDNNYFLEHEYLTATIKNIYDIYGNGDSETVYEWEFFVNRNPMHWEGLRIEESKLDDESIEIIRRLKNSGGENYTFEIIDIPEWLGVSPTEGTIGADKLETITFTVSNDVPHGYYADTVYAKTTDGNEPMVIMLDNLCNPPTWDVNEGDYQFSMTIIGNIQVDSAISEDLCDIVYAFVGDEVRGVAELQYFGEIESSASLEDVSPYQFYMTVYSNSEILNSEMLVLRVWDASERVVTTQSSDYYYFDPDALVGSTRSPDTIKTSNLALQETALDKGWNWISTNLVNDDMSLDYVLSFLTTTQDYIKGHNYFASNETGSWVGSLTELSANNSYMIQMSIEDTIQYFGEAVNLDSAFIPLDSNWNWIGYHPTSAQDLNSALISLNPAEGDLIKNQSYFSTYIEDVGWVGSLKEMVPGDGYKLQISQKDTLIYPEPVLSKSLSKIAGTANNKGETDLETSASVDWQVNPSHFEFNMNLIGHFDQSQFANLNANDLLGAFVGDECRGLIAPIYIESLDEYRIFLTVFSNNAVGDTVTFKLYDSKNDATLDIKNSVTFSSNKIIGSTNDPFLFTIFVTGIHSTGLIPEVFSLSQNYPNPFNPETIIEFGLPEAANVQIQVFNILGELVNTVTSREFDAGYYMVRWLGEDNYGSKLSSGTYIYRIVARYNKDTFSETRKMILLK
ncbi:MAG: T9SS type A sorting domain-containing protein, partial [Melioribacteraceae bacterium]|nr:T9SS type A sorting domain-containing protein [Melioribacteraceae bacterium]